MAALVAVGIGGVQYLRRYQEFTSATAWWVWFAVAAFIIVVSFGCAVLSQVIGPRRADAIFKVFALGLLVALIIWLRNTLDGRSR